MTGLHKKLTVGQKLTASLVAIVALLSVATVVTVGVLTNARVKHELKSEFRRTSEIAREYLDSRQRRLATGLESLVDSPETKSLLTMDGIDHATLLHSVTELQMVLEADIVLYADKRGKLLARTDDAFGQGDDLSANPLIEKANQGEKTVGLWDIDGVPHVACGYPIQVAGNVRGCILAGYAVTEEFGKELKALTLHDIAIVFEGNLVATSLPDRGAAEFERRLVAHNEFFASVLEEPAAHDDLDTKLDPHGVEIDVEGVGAAEVQPHVLDFDVRAANGPMLLLSVIPKVELYGFQDTMRTAMLVLAVASLLGGGLLSALLVRGVSRRVETTVGVLECVADGDYSQRLRFTGDDEFGRIASSVNTAINALVSTLEEVRQSSEREQHLDAERIKAIEERSTRDLQHANERRMAEEAIAARERQVEQERNARQAELAKQEAALNDAKERAEASAKLRTQERRRAEEERRAASIVQTRMNELLCDVSKSSHALDQVRSTSDEIAKIIDIISRLSTEANILSLNAGIEAVQAGEQGAGFAVVAEEMTRLSLRSREAAAEITTLIAESQAKIELSTDSAHRTARSLEEVGAETIQLLKRMSRSDTTAAEPPDSPQPAIGDEFAQVGPDSRNPA